MNRDRYTIKGGQDHPLLVLQCLSQPHNHLKKIFFHCFHNMEFYHYKEQINKRSFVAFICMTEIILFITLGSIDSSDMSCRYFFSLFFSFCKLQKMIIYSYFVFYVRLTYSKLHRDAVHKVYTEHTGWSQTGGSHKLVNSCQTDFTKFITSNL